MNSLLQKYLLALGFSIALMGHSFAQTFSFTTIDDPNATGSTVAQGVWNNNIVGYYTNSNGTDAEGFIYNGSSYTSLIDPNATESNSTGPSGTYAEGISGNDIVGYYFEGQGPHGSGSTSHGFLYNGSTYITIDDPNANFFGTAVTGISGNNVVGYYFTTNGAAGFEFNTTTLTYTTISDGAYTYPLGISGSNIVGNLQSTGFFYNGSEFTTLSYNGALGGPSASGISGNTIVGGVDLSTGEEAFLYNGTTFTTFSDPAGVEGSYAAGISGDEIVGDYIDSDGNSNGFLALPAIPEPSKFALVLSGIAMLVLTRLFVPRR